MNTTSMNGLALLLISASSLSMASQPSQSGDRLDPQPAPDELTVIGEAERRDRTQVSIETERLINMAGAAEDPLQSLFSLPGVTFDNDGEPVIRGSDPGDNAFYIDLIPAGKLYHVWGNSIFNKYVIQNIDLHPAAFSSRFGNATGGVIDVSLRNPKNAPLTTTASMSLLQAAALIETRLTDNQAIYLSARRSTLGELIPEDELSSEEEGEIITEPPAASDYQLKYLWAINERNTLTVTATGARDELDGELTARSNDVLVDPDFAGPLGYQEKFDSQGINWAWVSNDGHQSVNVLATHLADSESLFYGAGQFFETEGDINTGRIDWQQTVFDKHSLTAGIIRENSRYNIRSRNKFVNCSSFDVNCPTVDVTIINYNNKVAVNRNTAYLEGQIQLTEKQSLTAGLHYSDDNYLNADRVEPRIRWQTQLGKNWNTFVAAGQYSQLPALDEILPTIGNPNLETVKADHFVWGVEHSWSDLWHWKADLYYKRMKDLVISINDPQNPKFGQNYSNDAEGVAYGAEFLLNKDRGGDRWDGWLALSLGKAERTDIVNATTTPFDYDRPVKLDWVGNYQLSDRWRFGFRWTYQTGDRYTAIIDTARNASNPSVLEPIYGTRNAYASPDYHRLDLRAEYKKPTSWGYWSAFVDIVNAYGRENVSGYSFAPNEVDVLDTPPPGFGRNVPVQRSISSGAIPSIGFEVQF